MFKLFLFDVDGVLIRHEEYYSRILARNGYPNAIQVLDEFYKNDAYCTEGKEDVLVFSRNYLTELGWKKSSKEYFDEQFEYEKKNLDTQLLNCISNLIQSGYLCYLATDQNEYRKNLLLTNLNFKNIFNGWFVSSEIGYRKIHDEYWQSVIKCINNIGITDLSEVLFIDDRESNMLVAEKHGILGYHVSDNTKVDDLLKLLESHLS